MVDMAFDGGLLLLLFYLLSRYTRLPQSVSCIQHKETILE